MFSRIDELLQKMEDSYMDPESARKVGMVKQQYRLQKQRTYHVHNELQQHKT